MELIKTITDRERFQFCREIAKAAHCDLFTARRILDRLAGAYDKAYVNDPSVVENVLRGKFTFEKRV